MAMRNGRTVLGYQDHSLVDGGKARIILHCLVTPGDVAENQVLLDHLRRALFRRKLRPARLIADAKYATGENIRALEAQGLRAYVPLPDWDTSSPDYHTAAFVYDAERDVYHCPQGQTLKLKWTDEAGERAIYRARAGSGNACPVKHECTRSKQGRLLSRSGTRPHTSSVSAATEGRPPTSKRSGSAVCGSSPSSRTPSSGMALASFGCGAWLTSPARRCWSQRGRT